MAEYLPNSHRSKEAQQNAPEREKRVEKVVKGKAKTKKNNVRKFTDIFVSEDANNVKQYIFMDVFVPAFKKLISDIVTDGIDMFLYGESRGHKRKSGDRISYRSYYDDTRSERREKDRGRVGSRFDYDDIIFDTRGEAESAIDQMLDIIERYGFVTVGDLYDMADLTAPYTSHKYGWANIRTAEVQRVRDGYIIKLPRAMPID